LQVLGVLQRIQLPDHHLQVAVFLLVHHADGQQRPVRLDQLLVRFKHLREHHEINGAGEVFKQAHAHLLPVLHGFFVPQFAEDAPDPHPLVDQVLGDLVQGEIGVLADELGVRVQGVARDVEAHNFLLERENRLLVPLGHVRLRFGSSQDGVIAAVHPAEEALLAEAPVPLAVLGECHGPLEPLHELRPAAAHLVEDAGLDHAFQHARVDLTQIHPAAEVAQ